MTFSIAARDAESGAFGIAISSSSPAVAARCVHLRTGVGAACSQNITDPRLGGHLLDLLASGSPAQEAMITITTQSPEAAFRQLTVVDAQGSTAVWSGEYCLGTVATARSQDVVAAGNLLADPTIPQQMVASFTESAGRPFGDRLVGSLRAALAAGGEAGPVHSAGLVIVEQASWPTTDLRVDWSDDPIGDLEKLWRLWRPQAADYVTRALDPASAPGYGVKGE